MREDSENVAGGGIATQDTPHFVKEEDSAP